MAKRTTATSTLGVNLRRLRLAAGLSQGQLAEAAGAADATISRLERGRFVPSMKMVEKLAKALHATSADLLGPIVTEGRKPKLRACDARLLATVRGLDDGQVDDVTKAIKLMLSVGKRAARSR